jgi:hypothetical protein
MNHFPEGYAGNANGVRLVRLDHKPSTDEIEPQVVFPRISSTIEPSERPGSRPSRGQHKVKHVQYATDDECIGQGVKQPIRFPFVEMVHEAIEQHEIELSQVTQTLIDISYEKPAVILLLCVVDVAPIEIDPYVVTTTEVPSIGARSTAHIEYPRPASWETVSSDRFKFLVHKR